MLRNMSSNYTNREVSWMKTKLRGNTSWASTMKAYSRICSLPDYVRVLPDGRSIVMNGLNLLSRAETFLNLAYQLGFIPRGLLSVDKFLETLKYSGCNEPFYKKIRGVICVNDCATVAESAVGIPTFGFGFIGMLPGFFIDACAGALEFHDRINGKFVKLDTQVREHLSAIRKMTAGKTEANGKQVKEAFNNAGFYHYINVDAQLLLWLGYFNRYHHNLTAFLAQNYPSLDYKDRVYLMLHDGLRPWEIRDRKTKAVVKRKTDAELNISASKYRNRYLELKDEIFV